CILELAITTLVCRRTTGVVRAVDLDRCGATTVHHNEVRPEGVVQSSETTPRHDAQCLLRGPTRLHAAKGFVNPRLLPAAEPEPVSARRSIRQRSVRRLVVGPGI